MKIASAISNDELHVVLLEDDGKIRHCIRSAQGWSAWGFIKASDGHDFEDVSCAGAEDGLHLLVRNVLGIYFHSVRFQDGTWKDFEQLPNQPLLDQN
jgi:hypothetical protein